MGAGIHVDITFTASRHCCSPSTLPEALVLLQRLLWNGSRNTTKSSGFWPCLGISRFPDSSPIILHVRCARPSEIYGGNTPQLTGPRRSTDSVPMPYPKHTPIVWREEPHNWNWGLNIVAYERLMNSNHTIDSQLCIYRLSFSASSLKVHKDKHQCDQRRKQRS